MKERLKRVLVIFACSCLTACNSMQVVANGQDQAKKLPSNSTLGLKGDDKLRVLTTDGKRYEVLVKDFGDTGVDVNGTAETKPTHINFDQIDSVEHEQFDGGKTLALVGVVVLSLGVLAAKALTNDINNIGKKK